MTTVDRPDEWDDATYAEVRERAAKYYNDPDWFLDTVRRDESRQRHYWIGWRGFRFVPAKS